MGTSEYREGAPGGQARKRKAADQPPKDPLFKSVRIDFETWYSTSEAADLIGTTIACIGKWKTQGMGFIDHTTAGTKQDYILGSWLHEHMLGMKTVKNEKG